MNVRGEFYLFVFFIVTGQCWMVKINSSQCNHLTFEKLLSTLYKDVEFMHTKKNQLNIDAAYGLTLAEANLETMLTSENWKYLNEQHVNLILEIRELSKQSRQYVEENLKTEKNRILSKGFLKVDLWIRSIYWKDNYLVTISSPNRNLSESVAARLIHNGSPQGNESDYCLMQLINQYFSGKYCQLSNECVDMLMKEDDSRGYGTSHRLLIIQVANALNCEQHPSIDSKQLTEQYCRNMYQDLIDLEASNFPGFAVDLVIEQILLCGMEGYSEFVTSHYKNLLVNLPNSVGCYSATGFQQTNSHRSKRTSNPMDCGCDNHTCGVAAAALSLLLRECLDNQFIEYS